MKKKFVLLFMIAVFAMINIQNVNAQSWNLAGNSGTTNTNFVGTKDNKDLIFRSKNLERMRITRAGNIGIGTNVPATKLNVDAGSSVSLTSPGYAVIGNINSANMGLDVNVIQARVGTDASPLYLNYYGGNTIIGNASLSYYGALAYGSGYALYGYAPTGTGVYGYGSGCGVCGLAVSTGTYGYGFEGIYGETSDNISGWGGYFSGDIYSSGSYLGSDQKLKQNIKDFTSAMDIINQLHPKQYEFRQDGNYKLMNLPHGEHYGLIAQDVEKLLPSLVKNTKFEAKSNQFKSHVADPKNINVQSAVSSLTTLETIDFKALNYTELIPIIIKGMQEQQEVNDKQQQRIENLEKIIEKLSGNSNASSSSLSSENSDAYLKQNSPNPFAQNTIIYCNVPPSAKQAQLMIYSVTGIQIKNFVLKNGINDITISGGSLSSGEYVYSLLIDGKKIDSKKMMLTK